MENKNASDIQKPAEQVNNGFNYYHTSQSIGSRILKLVFRLLKTKRATSRTLDQLDLDKFNVPMPPKSFFTRFKITRQVYKGQNVFTLSPPHQQPGKPVVLFLHGGAYIISFTKAHWMFIRYLINKTGCTIIAPDYPLSPPYIYKQRFEMIEPVVDDLLKAYPPEQLIFMGDSAGGNFALALAQQLRLQKKPQPSQLVLISPWFDVSMTNPGMVESDKRDPYLGLSSSNYIGRMHAGDRDVKDPLVSPIYGSLEGLGKISVFTGANDLLNPDAKLFKQLADQKRIGINYFEYEHMVHDWVLFPIPEAKKAIRQIAGLVNGKLQV